MFILYSLIVWHQNIHIYICVYVYICAYEVYEVRTSFNASSSSKSCKTHLYLHCKMCFMFLLIFSQCPNFVNTLLCVQAMDTLHKSVCECVCICA